MVRLVSATGARVVKVKSLTTDEIGLNDALGSAGITPLETDLAELIVIAEERPSHLLVPALHRPADARSQSCCVRRSTGPTSEQPPALTAAAASTCGPRSCARGSRSPAPTSRSPRRAPSAWSSRRATATCTALPDTLVTVMGIELVAEWRDLAVLLQLLPRSATGERMNLRRCGQACAPATASAFHLVLLDAGRTRALADPEGRPALRCIRCSACVNDGPVYRQTGGHAYSAVYAGPIGAILQPQLDGERGVTASLLASNRSLRGLRRRLPRPDRHPADPRPRAREGRPRLEAGTRGTRAAPPRPGFHEPRALRAGPGRRARAPAARPP